LSTKAPECQRILKGGLDQYSPEHFGKLIFAKIRKSMELKGLITSAKEIMFVREQDFAKSFQAILNVGLCK